MTKTVKSIMEVNVLTVEKSTTMDIVASMMALRCISSTIVVSTGNPTGIISERDISQHLVAQNLLPEDVEVGAIMSSPLITIGPEASICRAAEKMAAFGIRRLAVMAGKRLIGIITEHDIIKAFPELAGITKFGRTATEQVFLIHSDGRLIAHVGSGRSVNFDNDIYAGMLMALKNFTVQVFEENKSNEFSEFTIGDRKMIVYHGKIISLALFISGPTTMRLMKKIRTVAKEIEAKYEHVFDGWKGNLDCFNGVKKDMEVLLYK